MQSVLSPTLPVKSPLQARLEAAGYYPGVPDHITADTLLADAETVHRSRCSVCRRRGLRCRPMAKGQSYRIVAVCTNCDHSEER